jgi:hypothetical protein
LFSETARLSSRLELPVNVLGISLLANGDSAHDYDVMFRINAVNDAMVSELVLPIVFRTKLSWFDDAQSPYLNKVAFVKGGNLTAALQSSCADN